ncbi:MAG: DUF3568 family protein [Isosphaerales bacterium]
MLAQRIALGLVLLGELWQIGCATVAPIVESRSGLEASYGGGRAIQEFAFPAAVVRGAVSEAMDDLKMTSIEGGRTGAVYKLDAKTADNRPVLITVRPHEGQTRVSCRIGWLGDEPLSKALLERTGVRLGTLPPAAIPENPPSAPAANPLFSRLIPPDEDTLRNIAEAPYRDRPVP